ncbi:hypothetical protein [Burkholderia ubonensis]|uniref:hypothetical protein n=1 Tax=Burkholderia ubonensis TaxID=101571 RepID=UPI000AF7AAE5|nr:hypothetical protein [Burkholderia ubonensis]
MPHNTLPDDLNPALIEVCARFISKLTGLVPPPVADFPPEMHAVFREFAAAAYAVVRENVATSGSRAVVSADDKLCAERYRWLRNTMQSAKGSASLNVNEHLSYYEPAAPGEEVRLQWYPNTPIGFYVVHGTTIDEAIDAARAGDQS